MIDRVGVGFTCVFLKSREWLKSHLFFLLGKVYGIVIQGHSWGTEGRVAGLNMGPSDFGCVTSWAHAPESLSHRGNNLCFAHLTEKEHMWSALSIVKTVHPELVATHRGRGYKSNLCGAQRTSEGSDLSRLGTESPSFLHLAYFPIWFLSELKVNKLHCLFKTEQIASGTFCPCILQQELNGILGAWRSEHQLYYQRKMESLEGASFSLLGRSHWSQVLVQITFCTLTVLSFPREGWDASQVCLAITGAKTLVLLKS